MSKHHYVVIMAGGIGSRFWPVSRQSHPKQFHDMLGTGKSLIQETYERYSRFLPEQNILVVTNRHYADLLKEQLPQLTEEQILLEPVGRNTAPCIAYAAWKIARRDPKAVLIASPSDHLIRDEAGFQRDMKLALKLADKEPTIVTVGITPTRPDTGYGYIQFVTDQGNPKEEYYKVKTFTEKPSLALANTFMLSGDFVWNSGIFVTSVATLLPAFQLHMPELAELFQQAQPQLDSPNEDKVIEEVYAKAKNISIDYGVMEKADNVYVIRSHFQWSDLGTWNSLYSEMEHDARENASTGEVLLMNAVRNVVKEYGNKLVVVKDVDDLIIVDTEDVLLVCPRNQEQTIREVVAEVRKAHGDRFV